MGTVPTVKCAASLASYGSKINRRELRELVFGSFIDLHQAIRGGYGGKHEIIRDR